MHNRLNKFKLRLKMRLKHAKINSVILMKQKLTDFQGTYLRDINNFCMLNRRREMPVQTRLSGINIFTKAKYHTSLRLKALVF
jgi:hypothetical protein